MVWRHCHCGCDWMYSICIWNCYKYLSSTNLKVFHHEKTVLAGGEWDTVCYKYKARNISPVAPVLVLRLLVSPPAPHWSVWSRHGWQLQAPGRAKYAKRRKIKFSYFSRSSFFCCKPVMQQLYNPRLLVTISPIHPWPCLASQAVEDVQIMSRRIITNTRQGWGEYSFKYQF